MSLYEDDLDSIMADAAAIGVPAVTLNGVDYPCEPGAPDAALAPDFEGEFASAVLTVHVPAKHFAAGVVPAEGDRAKYDGKLYRVDTCRRAVDGLEWVLGLGDPRK